MRGIAMFNVRALALSIAILWGASMMLMGWIASFGYGEQIVALMGSVYIGYHPGFLGGIIGGFWGAVDGGIGGLIFGLLYNWIASKF